MDDRQEKIWSRLGVEPLQSDALKTINLSTQAYALNDVIS